MSLISLLSRTSRIKLVQCSMPVRSAISLSRVSRMMSRASSCAVIVSPGALPRVSRMAAPKFVSGMVTKNVSMTSSTSPGTSFSMMPVLTTSTGCSAMTVCTASVGAGLGCPGDRSGIRANATVTMIAAAARKPTV